MTIVTINHSNNSDQHKCPLKTQIKQLDIFTYLLTALDSLNSKLRYR